MSKTDSISFCFIPKKNYGYLSMKYGTFLARYSAISNPCRQFPHAMLIVFLFGSLWDLRGMGQQLFFSCFVPFPWIFSGSIKCGAFTLDLFSRDGRKPPKNKIEFRLPASICVIIRLLPHIRHLKSFFFLSCWTDVEKWERRSEWHY